MINRPGKVICRLNKNPDRHGNAYSRRCISLLLTICLLLSSLLLTRTQSALAEGPSEYQLKAAFIYNFAKLTTWPDSCTNADFVIGVFRNNLIGDMLEETVADKNMGGRRLVVKYCESVSEVLSCQVIFVGQDYQLVTSLLVGKPILTVGESPDFFSSGGMINFQMIDSKVRFEINLKKAQESDLQISSKLLNLATKVRGE
jgi:hypothetical protein